MSDEEGVRAEGDHAEAASEATADDGGDAGSDSSDILSEHLPEEYTAIVDGDEDDGDGVEFVEPEVPEPSAEDFDEPVVQAFVVDVIAANVALFAYSLGAMLIRFEGAWLVGGGLVALGVAATVVGYVVYRKGKVRGEPVL